MNDHELAQQDGIHPDVYDKDARRLAEAAREEIIAEGAAQERERIAEYLSTDADKYLGFELREQAYALKNAAREIRDGAHQRSLREDD